MDSFTDPLNNIIMALLFFVTGTKIFWDELRDIKENPVIKPEGYNILKALLASPLIVPGLVLIFFSLCFVINLLILIF